MFYTIMHYNVHYITCCFMTITPWETDKTFLSDMVAVKAFDGCTSQQRKQGQALLGSPINWAMCCNKNMNMIFINYTTHVNAFY